MKTLNHLLFSGAALVLALLALASPTATAATDYYLKIDGIEGESNAIGHAGDIDVESFKAGVQQRGITDFGGGAGAGKSVFLPIRIIKFVDAATPQLFLACATGKRIKEATLTAVRSGREDEFKFLEIKLTDVLVSSINQEPGENDGVSILLETVSLNFGKIEISYIGQNPDGSPATPTKAVFDLRRNSGKMP
jgi:type VI secretion system secreted protein Hcp